MSEEVKTRDHWGSRLGYVMSVIGMAVGLGAIWRFPMTAAMNGGGAFVLAFVIVTFAICIPAGWAEIGFGRWAQGGPVNAFGKLLGTKGKALGGVIALIPLMLNMYYMIIVGWVIAYTYFSIQGVYFEQPVEFFQNFEANRVGSFLWTMLGLGITTLICLGGIKKGIEKACKYMLPMMFFILLVIAIRIAMIPGIAVGIDFYLRPDFGALLYPQIWVMAAGMALFALGLGPAFLLVYGSYLKSDNDVNLSYVTVALWSTLGCIIAGFATVPAVVLFELDKMTGSGLVFQVLPKVFYQLEGGQIWATVFFSGLIIAGLSTAIAIMEITVTAAQELFNWDRKKSVLTVATVTALGAAACVWNDGLIGTLDFIVTNIGFTFSATITAILLAWFYGAKRCREEWINPGSDFQIGKWYDFVYKVPVCAILLWFCYQAVVRLLG